MEVTLADSQVCRDKKMPSSMRGEMDKRERRAICTFKLNEGQQNDRNHDKQERAWEKVSEKQQLEITRQSSIIKRK